MEKELSQLLQENNSIIIPGFGSLIRSLSTGNISFNEFLKFNDHVLSKHLQQVNGLDEKAADQEIEKFIQQVQAKIENGSAYELNGLGFFSKAEDGKVVFEGNMKSTGEKPKAAVIASSPKPKPKPENKAEVNDKMASVKKDLNQKIKDKQEEEKKQKSEPRGPEKAKPVIQNPDTMSSNNSDHEKDPNYVHLSQEEIEARHLKRAKKGTIIFGILAIVVIAFFQYINPHHDHEEGGHENGTEQHENAAPALEMKDEHNHEADESSTHSEVKEEANASSTTSVGTSSNDPTDPTMESSIPVSNINSKHYIISAAFASAAKAKHQARLLMIMDYNAVVINPSEGKYYACTGSYDNYTEAQKALAEYKAKKTDAWLFTP